MVDVFFDFDNPSEFAYDPIKIEISGGLAKLKLVDNPGNIFDQLFISDVGFTYDAAKAEFVGGLCRQKAVLITEQFEQLFTVDTGFTYDSAKAEFVGGVCRQKTQRPTNATFGATYTNNINGNWGNGILTGTAIGGAAVSGGKLDLTGGTIKYVDYEAVGNAPNTQTGCIRFKLTPDWTGVSIGTQCFFDISKAGYLDVNSISLRTVSGSSDLTLRLCDQNGNYIVHAQFGGFSAVSGTTYEVELNFDFTTGQTRLFLDGINIGGLHTATGIRAGVINQFRIGSSNAGTNLARYKIEDFVVYSTVQHTANYTPGYILQDYDYLESVVICLIQSYNYNILSLDVPTITETNVPHYVINGYYWNGTAWAASSNTYATSMTTAQWLSNIATFPGGQLGTGVTVKIIFQNSNTQSNIAFIAFDILENYYVESAIICPEMEYTGQGTLISADDFDTVEANNPKYTLQIGRSGNYLYWNGTAWAVSDGTYPQANSKATFLAHLSTLPVFGQMYGQFKVHFQTSNSQSTIESLVIELTAQIYPLDSPSIQFPSINTNYIFSANETVEKPVNTNIQYTVRYNGIDYYFNGVSWAVSDGTWAKTNALDYILAHITTLLLIGATVSFKCYLFSDGTDTASIEEFHISFQYYNPSIPALHKTSVYGYLCGDDGIKEGIEGIIILDNSHLYDGKILIMPKEIPFITDANGVFITELIPTDVMNADAFYILKVIYAKATEYYKFTVNTVDSQDISSQLTEEMTFN